MTTGEWRRAAGLAGVIAALHVAGLVLLLDAGGVLGAGVGLTAYTLGLRHAFDADHIGAIDNTTRKLMTDGQRPITVGFFFSLGHSTVVLVMTALLALGIDGLSGETADVAGVVGPTVSGVFLLVVGVLNLGTLRRLRAGAGDAPPGGPMSRLLAPVAAAIRRPWQMYPLGLLFGLGFDTATEVALLATAGTAATQGLPLLAVLSLPLLFAAGMSLLDTLDGAFMRVAYGWALARPDRRAAYNRAVTGLSVLVALGIGTVELVQVTTGRLEGLDFTLIGVTIVGLFVLAWAVSSAGARSPFASPRRAG